MGGNKSGGKAGFEDCIHTTGYVPRVYHIFADLDSQNLAENMPVFEKQIQFCNQIPEYSVYTIRSHNLLFSGWSWWRQQLRSSRTKSGVRSQMYVTHIVTVYAVSPCRRETVYKHLKSRHVDYLLHYAKLLLLMWLSNYVYHVSLLVVLQKSARQRTRQVCFWLQTYRQCDVNFISFRNRALIFFLLLIALSCLMQTDYLCRFRSKLLFQKPRRVRKH